MKHEPVRRCILTGESLDASSMVRLAISPDGDVLPDVHGKAPGRGAWISVARSELDDIGRKKLRGALARAFKGGKFEVPEDLADRIETALKTATLDRLGLESRSGTLVSGSERVESAARGGSVSLLLHASDSAPDGRSKMAQAWRVGSDREGSRLTGILLPVDRMALSMALGRANAVHVALTNEGAARRLWHHLGRWLAFTGHDMSEAKRAAFSAGAAKIDMADGAIAVGAKEMKD